jgi:hypothetical protein
MAKAPPAKEGIYVEKPRADVYLALIILSTVCLLIAGVLMYLEWSLLKA